MIPWVNLAIGAVVALGAWFVLSRRTTGPGGQGAIAALVDRNGRLVATFLVGAVGFWVLLLILMPQLTMVDYSFHPKLPQSKRGGPEDVYTLENYRYFLFGSTRSTESWNAIHLKAFAITIVASVAVALVNFAMCYPLAFYMAQRASRRGLTLILLLLIIPYWVNELLRAFAFRLIFGTAGLLNKLLLGAGLVSQPVDFIGADVALYAGMTYAYLLLMLFPLYNALESLDRSQIEAARDLGAPWWHVHLFVVMPHAKAGIASGLTLVFMLTAGALAAPLVLSGPNTLWFTPILYDRFFQAFNWPQGAAYAIVLLAACILFVLAMMRLFRVSFAEIAR
jgi:spermidine/putrescine transport system permease protein